MCKDYLWYNFWKFAVTKVGLFFFYTKIEIIGKENIPKNKPVIVLPNHQNSFMDALLITTNMPGFMFFLTRARSFSSPFMNWFLRSLNMLPVYRVQDGLSSVTKNNEIFALCREYLKKNYPILVFPEANHNLKRRIRPLSKGFTRIAFEAEVENNWEMDLQLLPIGLNYSDHRRSRNRVRIVFGKPLSMISYKDKYEQDERKAANKLKNDVSDALKKLVMHVPNLDHYPAMHILLTEFESDVNEYIDPDKVNAKVKKISDQITSEIEEIGKKVLEISNTYDISIKTIFGRKKPWLLWILLFPIYVFSWLNNILPYQPARLIIQNIIKDHAFDAAIKFLLGLSLFPVFWVFISLILYLIGLPVTYIFGYLILSVVSCVNFKNAHLVFREASTKKKLKILKRDLPEVYATFVNGIKRLNDFRTNVLSSVNSK